MSKLVKIPSGDFLWLIDGPEWVKSLQVAWTKTEEKFFKGDYHISRVKMETAEMKAKKELEEYRMIKIDRWSGDGIEYERRTYAHPEHTRFVENKEDAMP